MRRRFLVLAAIIGAFSVSAVAVAYFQDAKQTNESVQAGPPIPWLRLWSEGSDPVNSPVKTLTYITQNNVNPATVAATGADQTLAVNLGKRSGGLTTWKPTNPDNADVNNRFNRIFTIEVPLNLPAASISVTMTQEVAVPSLSSGNLMFSSLEFATINPVANDETTSLFRGLAPAQTVTLTPGQKRQVNVAMHQFGQTDVETQRRVNTAIHVVVTTPSGGQVDYRVPVTVCNHIQQCP